MKTSEYFELIDIYAHARVPLRVWGVAAIGKSKILQQSCGDTWHYEDLRLATQDVGDLIGIPYIDHSNGDAVTRWAKPAWLQRIWEEHKKGRPTKLALEEKTRAAKEVTQAAFQLLTEHRIHEHELPPDCAIFALDNPPTDDYDVTPADKAENTRWGNIYVEANVDDWVGFAATALSPELTKFIATNHSALQTKGEAPWDVSQIVYATPRTWELADRIFRSEMKRNKDVLTNVHRRTLLTKALAALVGTENASAFVHNMIEEWVSLDKILSGAVKFGQIKEPSQIMRLQFDFLLFMTPEHLYSDGKPSQARAANFVAFIEAMFDQRKDLGVSLLKKWIQGDKKKLTSLLVQASPKIQKHMAAIIGV